MFNNKITGIGALLAATAVMLGALGAHALKAVLLPEQLLSFETAVRYQLYHALALLIIQVIHVHFPLRNIKVINNCMIAGTLCFSGSIYLLLATHFKLLGPVTPIGGVLLIVAWSTLALNLLRSSKV
ncbi:MAG: DUF423 domain-containing protein [Bacteroidia bacterium]